MHPAILHYSAIPEQPWPALEAALLPKIAPDKAASVGRLAQAVDRNATLLGLLLLLSTRRALGAPITLADVSFPARGKPFVAGPGDFSISHAGTRVACVSSLYAPLGLDLETEGRLAPAALRLIAEDEELACVAAGSATATGLAVGKEAVVKAAGEGAASLRAVRVMGGHATFKARRYRLRPIDLGPGYVAMLADREQHGPVVPAYVAAAELLGSFG